MMQAKNSTRFWLILSAVLVTAAVEVARHFGIEVDPDALERIQAGLALLAGLDTVRPLGAPQSKAE